MTDLQPCELKTSGQKVIGIMFDFCLCLSLCSLFSFRILNCFNLLFNLIV